MGLICNIDQKGRWARAICGVMTCLAGLLFLILAWPPTWWQWVISLLLSGMGAFQIFEARKGWCVMRAMGFRTPM